MKYLKKFENHAAYAAAQSGLILPNVSLCVQEGDVHYNPSSPMPPTPTYEYVDLGLPSGTKWATMNVGANSITDYGNYYQYGKGAATYQETSGDTYYEGTENPLAASADTAAQVWGGSWHMPTSIQFQELLDNTTYEWVTNYQGSGINGSTFTANGQTLFFPAASDYQEGNLGNVGVSGFYWTSTPLDEYESYMFFFQGVVFEVDDYGNRSYGFAIRPVMDA